jgi:hypothetical protein
MSVILNTEKRPILVAFTNAGEPTLNLSVTIKIFDVSVPGVSIAASPASAYSIGAGTYGFSIGQLPASPTDGELVFRIDGSDTLEDADRYKFGVLVFGGDIENRFDAIDDASLVGIGRDVSGIDQDQGGVDTLRILDSQGDSVAEADINIFLKSDWDAGNRNKSYRDDSGAWSQSRSDGRWKYTISLNTGTYILSAGKPGQTLLAPVEFTVS